jgi:YD repeat-containing protein
MIKNYRFFYLILVFCVLLFSGCFSATPKINSLKILNKILVQTDCLRFPETILILFKKNVLVLKNKIKSISEYEHKVTFGKISDEKKLASVLNFDNSANMTETTLYNTGGRIEVKNTFKYDANGNVAERTCYYPDGSVKFKEIFEYKYDNSDNVISAKITNTSNNSMLSCTFKYNESNNIVERNVYNADGSLDGKQSYKYADNGNLIDITEYKPDGSILARVEYVYNDKILLTAIKRNVLNRNDRWAYSYDNDGNIIEEDTEVDGKTTLTKFKYGDKGLLIEADFCNRAKEPEFITKYEYEKY